MRDGDGIITAVVTAVLTSVLWILAVSGMTVKRDARCRDAFTHTLTQADTIQLARVGCDIPERGK